MAMFNYLSLNLQCPRCGSESEMQAEFRFGLRDLSNYHLGDPLRWEGEGTRTPAVRPEDGNYTDEAYVVCPSCQRDFWLKVTVQQDIITRADVDPTKEPYIPDDEVQPPAAGPSENTPWDPKAHAEAMKKLTIPPVSAFFLIDSLESIQTCIHWLELLKPYGMPDMQGSQYFADVQNIFVSGQKVINFDYDFSLVWQGREYPEKLRCHYFEKGRYEMELWLPGVLANEIADSFKDGHAGFFCAFMSHAFYD